VSASRIGESHELDISAPSPTRDRVDRQRALKPFVMTERMPGQRAMQTRGCSSRGDHADSLKPMLNNGLGVATYA